MPVEIANACSTTVNSLSSNPTLHKSVTTNSKQRTNTNLTLIRNSRDGQLGGAGGFRDKFATLWLAATNPKRLQREAVREERLSEKCRQVLEYLSPFFAARQQFFDKNGGDDNMASNLIERSKDEQGEDGPTIFTKCRLSLHVAVRLLVGLQVLLDRKVIFVRKELEALLKEVRIHLNMEFNAKSVSGHHANRRKNQQQGAKRTKPGSGCGLNGISDLDLKMRLVDNGFDENGNILEDNLDLMNNIDLEMTENFLKNMMDFQIEKLDFLESDKISDLNKDFERVELDVDPDYMPNGHDELIKFSQDDLNFNYQLDPKMQKMSFSRIHDPELTPNHLHHQPENNYDFNNSPMLNQMKRTPDLDDLEKFGTDLKRKKLAYESMADEKAANKIKTRGIKVDPSSIISTQTIKHWLANTRDIVKRKSEQNFGFVNYLKNKIYSENESDIKNFISEFDRFKTRLSTVNPAFSALHSLEKNLHPENKNERFSSLLQLRENLGRNDQPNAPDTATKKEPMRISHTGSNSSLNLRNANSNAYNETLSSLGISKSKNEIDIPDPVFNPADDYQNTNFVGEFNTRDEIDFTPMKDGNRFDLNFNAEFCSRKQAAKGFYTLLRNSMTRSIEIKQKHPFAPIYIMKI